MQWEPRTTTGTAGTSFTFANLGDSIVGTVRGRNLWEGVDRFTGRDSAVWILQIETDSGDVRDVWLRSAQLYDAVCAAAPGVGDRIRITWATNRDTGKPTPLRVYEVKVKHAEVAPVAPAPAPAAVAVDDLL